MMDIKSLSVLAFDVKPLFMHYIKLVGNIIENHGF